jgi:hypothetical protein
MNAAELVAALDLPEQRPDMQMPAGSMMEHTTTRDPRTRTRTRTYPSHFNSSDTFLNATRAMMSSQGSLLDDVDQDVEVGMGRLPPALSPIRSNSAAIPVYPSLSPVRTNSTAIPVYPRAATATNTNTSNTANAANTATAARNNTTVPNYQPNYQNNYEHCSSHDDGSYSDDSAVRQARENMEEIRNLHPVRKQLPVPEEMPPPLPRANRVLAEPSIPVPRSSRRVRSVGQHNAVQRPPDLVRGHVYGLGNNDNGNDQPPMRRLRPEEMLVRCESCQRYLQVCKSAIVVQCPACQAISPAKSTN